MIVEVTWSSLKSFSSSTGLGMLYVQDGQNVAVTCCANGMIVKCLLVYGSSDHSDFVANYQSVSNRPVSMQSQPFASKVLPNGKKLYVRNHGIQQALSSGANTISYTIPYQWVKMIGAEIINGEALDTVDFKVYDDANGTYSTVPNYMLNQFGYAVNISPGFYQRVAGYDADLYINMVLKLTYTSASAKTVGVNILLNEVK